MKGMETMFISKVSLYQLSVLCCCMVIFLVSCRQEESIEPVEDANIQYCRNLSQSLGENDVTGEWIAEYGGGVDKIIIQADHAYQQIYSNEVDDIFIKTDWNEWQIEDINGVTYLKLSNMHRCDSLESICLIDGGGGGDNYWFDYCSNKLVRLDNSVTLIVLRVVSGDIYYEISDLKLCHFSSDGDSGASCFRRLK